MNERIVPLLVLIHTIIGSEAARVMPKSLDRTETRISMKQEFRAFSCVGSRKCGFPSKRLSAGSQKSGFEAIGGLDYTKRRLGQLSRIGSFWTWQ